MELWELKSLTLLREMPSDFPVITALVSVEILYGDWAPSLLYERVGWSKVLRIHSDLSIDT